MSKTVWSKFFWTDWMSDMGLRRCSVAARGLWMDMLCVAAQHVPIGYVAVQGEGLSEEELGRLAGLEPTSVSTLLGELERNGVFSRNRDGLIYSRRMVADSKKAARVTKNLPPSNQRENNSLGASPLASGSWLLDFEKWYSKYPHKIGRGAAETAFQRIWASDNPPTIESLLRGLETYIATKPKDRAWCNPATWLNQRRWEDVPAGSREDDSARFRRMLQHERETGQWPFKTSKGEIPGAILAEFSSGSPSHPEQASER